MGEESMTAEEVLDRLLQVQNTAFALFVERRHTRDPAQPTRIQVHVLAAIQEGHATSVSDVAELLRVSVPTASQLVNTMVERGWIARKIPSEDRRRQLIHLTPDGEKLLAARINARIERLRALIAAMNEEERIRLVQVAERVAELMPRIFGGSTNEERGAGQNDG